MPAIIPVIIGIIQAIAKNAPDAIEVFKKAKEFIGSLLGAKLITKAQQDAMFAEIDKITSDAQAGKLPEWWGVERDPE